MTSLDGGNIALCVIISIQFAIASGLVIYLLLRPKEKKPEKGLEPTDEVYTTYGDKEPEKENGHVSITIEDDDKKSVTSEVSSDTPKKIDPNDVKLVIDDDVPEQETPEPEKDAEEVRPSSRASSSSSSSSESEKEEGPHEDTAEEPTEQEEQKPEEVEVVITKTEDETPVVVEEEVVVQEEVVVVAPTVEVSEVKVETEVQVKEAARKDSSSSSSSSESESEINSTTLEFNSPERKKFRSATTFKSGWKKRVTLEDLYQAKIITTETTERLERGEATHEEVERSIERYLIGLQPIAGLLMAETGEKVTLYDAWKRGLLRRGTAISLLEAQAATGRILNPINGDKMSVAEASQVKLIDRQFQAVLARAERAVTGYKSRRHPEPLSLFEAMQQGLVVENHGIRLLEAQIATGGIIDPKANHRLDVEMAFERKLFDRRLHAILEDPSDDTRGFFDPNTEENLTYLELMSRCVIDKDTGFRLLPFAVPIQDVVKPESKTKF